MATIKLQIDTGHGKVDGTFPLVLRVNHQGQFRINLDLSVEKDQFDGEKIVNHPQHVTLNSYLKRSLTDASNIIFDLKTAKTLDSTTNKELKALIEDKPIKEEVEKDTTFQKAYDVYVARLIKTNTISSLKDTYSKVLRHYDLRSLTLKEMDLSWLKDFDFAMTKDGLAPNTRGIYLRNIRAIYNDAIDRNSIGQGFYPFRRFKIPKAATIKRSLSAEDMKAIKDCELAPHLEKYRDVFMLIFYLMGINCIDLLKLEKIRKGRIDFIRSKTGKVYSMLVLPEAMKIIKKYRGDELLLDFMESRGNYKSFRARVNDGLKEIAKKALGEDAPPIGTYYARHSWATIAAGLDIPKETIAAALGHGSNTVTDIYIKFDNKKIDIANRQVIDCVLNENKEEAS